MSAPSFRVVIRRRKDVVEAKLLSRRVEYDVRGVMMLFEHEWTALAEVFAAGGIEIVEKEEAVRTDPADVRAV